MKPVLAALLAISLTFAAADSTKTKPATKPAGTATKSTATSTKSTNEKSSSTTAAKTSSDKSSTTVKTTNDKSSSTKSASEKSGSTAKSTTEKSSTSAKSSTSGTKSSGEKSEQKEKESSKSSSKSDSATVKKSTSKEDTTKSESSDSLEKRDDSADVKESHPVRNVDTLVLIDSSSYFDSAAQSASANADSLDSAGIQKESKEYKTIAAFLKVAVLGILALLIAGLFGFTAIRLARKREPEVRRKDGHKNFLTRTRISVMDSEVQLVCKYVEGHYYDPELTSESVCRALITGQSFVETLFSRELDMTLDQFITHVRIHHALGSINDGFRGSAEKLGEKCGYLDMTRFAEDFRTITGHQLSTMLAERSDV